MTRRAVSRALGLGLVGSGLAGLPFACGGDGNRDGTGGATADSGADADAPESDAPADGDGPAPEGCIDIRVVSDELPNAEDFTAGNVGQMIPEPLWRDENGLHFAWNAVPNPNKPTKSSPLTISSFDPDTGELIRHRGFTVPTGAGAVGPGPAGSVALAVGRQESDGGSSGGVLLTSTAASPNELYVSLGVDPGSTTLVHVGWDGEAFAVHIHQAGELSVARVALDGTVLLAPQFFGYAGAFAPDVRMATDPESGVSFEVGGEFDDRPWLTGHLRDGTPMSGHMMEEPPNWQNVWNGVFQWAVKPVSGGAVVAWTKSGGPTTPETAFAQRIDTGLAPMGSVLPVQGTYLEPNNYASEKDITVQPLGAGWWLGVVNGLRLAGYTQDGSGTAAVQELLSIDHPKMIALQLTHLGSAAYGDELWLGFRDDTGAALELGLHQPYRIVRVKPGCTYPTMLAQRAREPTGDATPYRDTPCGECALSGCAKQQAACAPDPACQAFADCVFSCPLAAGYPYWQCTKPCLPPVGTWNADAGSALVSCATTAVYGKCKELCQ